MKCYPNDPYLSFWNQWPSGELMTVRKIILSFFLPIQEGMAQAMNLGLVFKKRYIDTLKFMSPNYRNSDVRKNNLQQGVCGISISDFESNSEVFKIQILHTPDSQYIVYL